MHSSLQQRLSVPSSIFISCGLFYCPPSLDTDWLNGNCNWLVNLSQVCLGRNDGALAESRKQYLLSIHDYYSMHVSDSHNTAAGMPTVNYPSITCAITIWFKVTKDDLTFLMLIVMLFGLSVLVKYLFINPGSVKQFSRTAELVRLV